MDNVIGLITANYDTPALGELTDERTIASLLYGGRYRLVDFPLSNMVNSDITTVGLITPYKYRSIIDHVGSGSAWNLDRKNGGLYVLPGSVFGISNGESRFLLRDISRNIVYLMRSPAPYVIVTAAGTVCTMTYNEVIDQHIKSGADITLVYTDAREDDPNVTSIRTDGERVTAMPRGVKKGEKAFTDTFVISRSLLLKIVEWYSAIDHLDLFEVLEADFDKMDVRLYKYEGYTRTISTLKGYFEANMELLDRGVQNALFTKEAPVLTKVVDLPPTRYCCGSTSKNSLIPTGCRIEGNIENSILFAEVRVGKGAVVKNSIIMRSCVIEEGAVVENAIIDRGNIIAAGSVIKGSGEVPFIMAKNMP